MNDELFSSYQYWLCVVFDENANLIHGCLACNAEPWADIPQNLRHYEIALEGGKLDVIQALLSPESASEIVMKLETESVLDLSQHNGPTIKMGGQRHLLIDAFGRSARPAITYSTVEFPDLSDALWINAVGALNSLFGEDFRQYPERLGAFFVLNDVQSETLYTPINFEIDRREGDDLTSYPDSFTLIPNGNSDNSTHVLVDLLIGGEPAYSALFTLIGQKSQSVSAVPFDEYRVSVFNESGKIVFREGYPLMVKIGVNMSALGQTYSLNDNLAQSAQGLGKNALVKAKTVTTRSTTRSSVGLSNIPFDVHLSKTRSLMRRLTPPSTGDRWFPRGIASEIDVIQHFNMMLNGARISSAIIVDPFFGVDTLRRVIARFENLDVGLTVVMSLSDTDPETNDANENLVVDLKMMLEELHRHPHQSAVAGLRVINLTDGSRQAFHDRYLLLSPHDGEREVYLLSNSLNRMAGNWPFCISKLDPAAARDAASYIDGLVQARDISGSTKPTVTFQWPPHENR